MKINHNITNVNRTLLANRNIKYIVVHYTGNIGDTAYNNTQYFKFQNRNASAHYFVDDTSIWQCVEDKNIAWHCGSNSYKHKDCRNSNSIGIELCNGNNDFNELTIQNAVSLIQQKMKEYNIPIENVVRHYDVTGKICPKPFIDEKKWVEFKNKLEGGDIKVARTVMTMPTELYIQEITPSDFKIEICDKEKKNLDKPNYFNCGYFTYEGKGINQKSIPVGNLAIDGNIISQSKDNPDWINVAKKKLTTIYTTNDGKCGILKTNNLLEIKNLKNAVSGIPIIINARYVPEDDIKAEGYFGTAKNGELYDTWHGFLGIRHNKLVYVAMKCGFGKMCWALVGLGIYDAIKLDGGGSFILKNGEIIKSTSENRKIHNVGVWM